MPLHFEVPGTLKSSKSHDRAHLARVPFNGPDFGVAPAVGNYVPAFCGWIVAAGSEESEGFDSIAPNLADSSRVK